jgi:endonuclease-3
MKTNTIIDYLDKMIPNVYCPLKYNKDYELLIAVLLSAQCTDERVNKVTPVLFSKYDIFKLACANEKDIEDIIRPCGNQVKKSKYIVEIAKRLVEDYEGKVPNNREYLESLPGIGRKSTNVVLNNIFNVPAFAVDTHVSRVAKRLGITNSDDVRKIEEDLMKKFPEDKWGRLHHQFLLFGRYICKSQNPNCKDCLFSKICTYYKNTNK